MNRLKFLQKIGGFHFFKGQWHLFKRFNLLKYKETELITPPLDGTILEGVTRQSILEMTRKWVKILISKFKLMHVKHFVLNNIYRRTLKYLKGPLQ